MRQTKAICLVGDLLSSFSCSKYITPMIDQTDMLNKFTGPTKTTTNNSYYELIVLLLPKKIQLAIQSVSRIYYNVK